MQNHRSIQAIESLLDLGQDKTPNTTKFGRWLQSGFQGWTQSKRNFLIPRRRITQTVKTQQTAEYPRRPIPLQLPCISDSIKFVRSESTKAKSRQSRYQTIASESISLSSIAHHERPIGKVDESRIFRPPSQLNDSHKQPFNLFKINLSVDIKKNPKAVELEQRFKDCSSQMIKRKFYRYNRRKAMSIVMK